MYNPHSDSSTAPVAIVSFIHPHSEELQDVIETVPSWIVRWGNTLYLLLFVAILIIAWSIHYPTLVEAPVQLRSVHTPKAVTAKAAGQLDALFCKEGDYVRTGQLLAAMKATADQKQVQELLLYLELMHKALTQDSILTGLPPVPREFDGLGELQAAYQNFAQFTAPYLAIQHSSYSWRNQIAAAHASRSTNVPRAELVLALNTLRSYVKIWEGNYLLTAPVAGRIYFTSFWEEQQTLAANQQLFIIAPTAITYFGEAVLPLNSIGKIKVGQEVILKINAYPFEEYGTVKGKLTYISQVPTDNGFRAKVSLPHGLMTTHGKIIEYRQGLHARAAIVTQDARLLERMFVIFKRVLTR